MSISKCPVCQSTDINGITCNNCGAMLLFVGDDGKTVNPSAPQKKEPKTTESIIQEILESANVKSSPFEKIAYIDDESKEGSIEDINSIVADKSFADLAREMGYDHDQVTSDEGKNVTDEVVAEEATEEIISEETVAEEIIPEEIVSEEIKEESLPVVEETTENPSDISEDNTSYEEEKIPEEVNEEITVENEEEIPSYEESSVEPEEKVSDEVTEEISEETDDIVSDNYAEPASDEKVSLVERISQKVSEKIEKEELTNKNDDDEVDLFAPPVWEHSEKTIVKEKRIKKSSKEEQTPCDQVIDDKVMEIDTGFNKVLNICRFSLMILMLITVVCMFLPSTRIGGFSSGQSVQIFAVISVIPFVVGFVLCIKEKQYIRKFIYSLILSIIFAFAYMVFMFSFSSGGFKGIVYLVLSGLISVVSLTGIRTDRSSSVRKINTWFDAFTYILLAVNILVILFVGVFAILVPDMVGGPVISVCLIQLCAVMIVSAISAILMLKRVKFGSDLLMISTIAFIVVSIMSYNKMMGAVSFDYTVNIPYMHYMGMLVSGLNIFCTAFSAGMFLWMKYISGITPKKENKKKDVENTLTVSEETK